MPLLIAILLGLAVLLLVIYPLLAPAAAEEASDVRAPDAAEQEQGAKQALRDVDFDHRLGNLDDGDYEALRERYEGRALAAMKARYDRERALDALIERQLADVRDELAQPTNGRKSAKSAKSATPNASPNVESPAKSATPATTPAAEPRKPATPATPATSSSGEKTARSATDPARHDGGVRLRRRRGA